MPHYCVGFLFVQIKDDLYTALIDKTKPDWQAGRFNGIGGKVEFDESVSEAMKREGIEEAEIFCTALGFTWNFVGSLNFPNGAFLSVYTEFVRRDDLESSDLSWPIPGSDEVLRLLPFRTPEWFSRRDLIEDVRWLTELAHVVLFGPAGLQFDMKVRAG